ncbi:MAG: Hsp20/alpha crystallin family protein [Rhodoferax sp.]|nr:Hsp20/alpha crystallin family protein [Rhodoferax sp.]
MYRIFPPGDLFSELSRLQRQYQRYSNPTSNIRGYGRSEFPAMNIGGTPDSVEIYAFAPGLDPASIDVTIERGVLTLAGERTPLAVNSEKGAAIHVNERFSGPFRRAVSLPDDADPAQVSARYTDGILCISVKRRESAKRRQVEVQ